MTNYAKYQLDKFQKARTPGDYVGVVTETVFQPEPMRLQRYGAPTDRAQLTSSGVGEVHATLAIPYMNYVPRSSDADAQGIQIIIAAIQRRLGLPVTGYLNAVTKSRIQAASGPDWFDKKWNAILGDAILGGKQQGMSGLGDTQLFKIGPIGVSPAKIAIAGLIGFVGWQLLKR